MLGEDPANVKALYRLAVIQIGDKEWRNARENLEKCQRSNQAFREAEVVERLGDICFKSEEKEFETALGYYERAEKLTPESYEIHLKKGKCFEKLREFRKAIEQYETAVELNKRQNALPLFRLAWAYIRSGEKQKGIDMLKEALEIEPENVEVLTRLGESLLRE